MKKDLPTASIIVPNHNGVDLLVKHLPDVIRAAGEAEVVVVDDASTDSSLAVLAQSFPTVKVLRSARRLGFAGSVNLGVREARSEIVVLINSDVSPEANFLPALLSCFRDPTVFAVGCLEKSHENERIVERGRGIGWWEKGFFLHKRGDTDQTDTAWVSGGSGAFRRPLWEKFGGMDELYSPFYWEDIDLSYTAVKSGYRLFFVPQSIVHHYHQSGTIMQNYSPALVRRIAYRNQFIFVWKNLSDKRMWIEHLIWLPIRLLQALLRGDGYFWWGFISALTKIDFIWKSRKRAAGFWREFDRNVYK